MNAIHTEISKFLSFVLRHQPEAIGLQLDREGWANIVDLVARARQTGKSIDESMIRAVVAGNDKKRFAISDDGLRIRAVQGHSTSKVDIQFSPQIPPSILYHGTATRFLDSIKQEGLKPGHRQYVHLSADRETAVSVGQRYGIPIVLKIDAKAMQQQGFQFYQAENGVWLTKSVPSIYLDDSVSS